MKVAIVFDTDNNVDDLVWEVGIAGTPIKTFLKAKKLPERMEYVKDPSINANMFANGWNCCLDEIDPNWDEGAKPWR